MYGRICKVRSAQKYLIKTNTDLLTSCDLWEGNEEKIQVLHINFPAEKALLRLKYTDLGNNVS